VAKKRTTRKAKPASKQAARSTAKKKKAAKRATAKKAATKKTTSKTKDAAKKATAKKTVTKKKAAKKAAKKSTRKAATKKVSSSKKPQSASAKSTASKKAAKKTAARKTVAAKKPPAKRVAAKQTSPAKPATPKAAGKAKPKPKPPIYEPKTPHHDLAELTSLPPEKQCKTSADAGLNTRDLEHFRRLLLDKRAELRGDVTAMRSQAFGSSEQVGDESRMPLHMADLGSDNFEHELTLALVEGEQVILREIEEALERIKNRTFGICLGTGRPIGKKRLTAKPWAKYCYEYTLAQERGAR
jgi:DnaK suppressor protein